MLNVHFHALVLEGSYSQSGQLPPVFRRSRPPGDEDVAWVARRVFEWVERVLERRGVADRAGFEAAFDEVAEAEPALAALSSAAAKGTYSLEGPWARKVERLRGEAQPRVRRKGRMCADVEGFNLHAGTFVAQGRRRRLEQLCNYVARPALSERHIVGVYVRRAPEGVA